MYSDSKTSISDLRNLLLAFREEREWLQFHDPKNLAEAISIEASELLQLFLWKSQLDVASELDRDPQFKTRISEELADVICFALNLANVLDIDVSASVAAKIDLNRHKYPIAKARGRATKYTDL